MEIDVLIITAHPDDAEIGIGGTIAKLTSQGYKVGIIDSTQGEMGTRGTIKTRKEEAENSNKILGVTIRENLKLKDGELKPNKKHIYKVIEMIRKYRPKILIAPYFNDRHPDHVGAGQIAKEAIFLSGLPKVKTICKNKIQEAYRPDKLYYFMMTYDFPPSFIMDISEHIETKIKAIRAFKTQFYDPNEKEAPETFISKPGFIEHLKARAQYYGFKIRKDYGEPFFCEEDIEFDFSQVIRKQL